MSDRGAEWPYVVAGFAAAVLVLAAVVAGWGVWRLGHPPASKFSLTEKCLRNEKHLVTRPVEGDPLAASANDGALATTVEGNPVTLSMWRSEERAARAESTYRTLGHPGPGRLERRGRTVYLWASPSSPTQRQALYDCAY